MLWKYKLNSQHICLGGAGGGEVGGGGDIANSVSVRALLDDYEAFPEINTP